MLIGVSQIRHCPEPPTRLEKLGFPVAESLNEDRMISGTGDPSPRRSDNLDEIASDRSTSRGDGGVDDGVGGVVV